MKFVKPEMELLSDSDEIFTALDTSNTPIDDTNDNNNKIGWD